MVEKTHNVETKSLDTVVFFTLCSLFPRIELFTLIYRVRPSIYIYMEL